MQIAIRRIFWRHLKMSIFNVQRSVSELEAATGEKKGGGDVSGVRSLNIHIFVPFMRRLVSTVCLFLPKHWLLLAFLILTNFHIFAEGEPQDEEPQWTRHIVQDHKQCNDQRLYRVYGAYTNTRSVPNQTKWIMESRSQKFHLKLRFGQGVLVKARGA